MKKIIKVHLRTVKENGMGLMDQDYYHDKMTINHGRLEYADEDWYAAEFETEEELVTIIITGQDIPPDWDDTPGHHMEIKVYVLDAAEERDIDFHDDEPLLVDGRFRFEWTFEEES
ncbi:hypothetical protein [Aureitalea marina]|uniref:Uncharacterized protein n=1 Tax=Aureitalea marina TaxID=930804 RepID=A0A2S7KR66_9FLAO|nr:hypothetical protein [Aureitalea marina]PQB05097.1 hypothetical protein BST85_09475 [Aureitalea marina]